MSIIKFLAIMAFGQFAAAQINKPLIDPPMPSLDQGLLDNLKPTQFTHDQWGPGWIPQDCKTMVENEGLSPSEVEVFNIQYTDVRYLFECVHIHVLHIRTLQIHMFEPEGG